MNKFGRFVWVLLSISFGQQAFALDCVAPPEQPFETATTVFLAQVTENSLETADSKAAPIMILTVYKGDVVQIKKNNPNIEFSDVMGVMPDYAFSKGVQFLLYDQAAIGDCYSLNSQVTAKQIKAFEKEHKPIWVKSNKRKRR